MNQVYTILLFTIILPTINIDIFFAKQLCQSTNCLEVNPYLDSQLVHIAGTSETRLNVIDPDFNVIQPDCTKLIRCVEMLQWVEHSKKQDKRTTYSYHLEWKSTFQNTSSFHHSGYYNDESKWIVQAKTFVNEEVTLGMYNLNPSLLEQVSTLKKLTLNSWNGEQAIQSYSGKGIQYIFQTTDYIMFQQQQYQSTAGDLRVKFQMGSCGPTTVVAEQQNNTFVPWRIQDKYEELLKRDKQQGNCHCDTERVMNAQMDDVNWLFESIYTKEQAFQVKLDQEATNTILIRLLGWLLMGFGLLLIFSPITNIISWLPLFGNFLAQLSSFIFCLISFTIATPLTIITISISWLFYRPKVGLMLLMSGFALGFTIYGIILLSA